jgi:hypothetical protein
MISWIDCPCSSAFSARSPEKSATAALTAPMTSDQYDALRRLSRFVSRYASSRSTPTISSAGGKSLMTACRRGAS